MQGQAARGLRARDRSKSCPTASKLTNTRASTACARLRQIEDAELIALCLERDKAAWREFTRRFEPALTVQVHELVTRALRTVLDQNTVKDVLGALYVHILDEDMRRLRSWHQCESSAPFTSWLSTLAYKFAVDHVCDAFTDLSRSAKVLDQLRQCDDANGDTDLMEIDDLDLSAPITPRRGRKW
jgi:hypothetical protein